MDGAIRRVPAIADAGVTPDDQRARGVHARTTSSSSASREVRGFFVAAGFCAHGIAGAGGIGRQVAQLDRRRRARARPLEDGHPAVRAASTGRSALHARPDATRTTRPTTTSTTRTRSAWPAGRCGCRRRTSGSRRSAPSFGEKSGWERPNWFEPNADGAAVAASARGAPAARLGGPALVARRSAPRRSRPARPPALFDEIELRQDRDRRAGRARASSSGCARTTSTGRSARSSTPRCSTAAAASSATSRSPGSADDAVPARDRDGVRQPRPRLDPAATLPARRLGRRVRDVTVGAGLLRAVGPAGPRHPRAADEATTSRTRRSRTSPRARSRVGAVPVLALRVTYVGELGWELYAPTEYGRGAVGRRSGRRAGRTAWSPAATGRSTRSGSRRATASGRATSRPRRRRTRRASGSRSRSTRASTSSAARRSSRRRRPARASGCAASSSTTRARSASATSRSGSTARSSAG